MRMAAPRVILRSAATKDRCPSKAVRGVESQHNNSLGGRAILRSPRSRQDDTKLSIAWTKS
jgi:hypothetical protein